MLTFQSWILRQPLTRCLVILLLLFANKSNFAQNANDSKSDSEYSKTINRADNFLLEGNYLQALNEYEKASDLYFRQTYPKKKIEQINKTLFNTPLSKTLYDESIRKGDSCFAIEDYKRANAEYYNALRVDREAQYPINQLREISKLYTDPENENRFRITLINAGSAFESASYEKSIAFYKEALIMKPSEQWLNKRIEELILLKEKNNNAMDSYSRILMEADNFLVQKKWAEALAAYTKALALRTKENYPAAKILFIDHQLAYNGNGIPTYTSLIEEADKFYKLRDYDNAAIHFQQALNMQPNEQYPKNMLKKLSPEKTAANTPAIYDASVANADILSLAGDPDAALLGYQRCLSVNPADQYVSSRIKEINQVSKGDQGNQDAYKQAITNGDKSMANNDNTKALSQYRYASWLKPEESYPKSKIEQIQNAILLEKTKQANDQKTVTLNESTLVNKDKRITVSESHPTTAVESQLKIDQQKDDEIKISAKIKDSIDVAYKNLIASADKAYDEEDYHVAINDYNLALKIIPDRNYPVEKINDCNAKLEKLRLIQEKYDIIVAKADYAYSIEEYDTAIKVYKSALNVRPDDNYPRQQLEIINSILEKQKTVAANKNSLAAIQAKNPTVNKISEPIVKNKPDPKIKPVDSPQTEKPIVVKPNPSPKNAAQEAYDNAIAFADKSFSLQDYPHALNGYKAALKLKPNETYPKEKIEAITEILNSQTVQQQNYQKIISSADKAFNEKEYSNALSDYKSALEIIPGQKYPQDKIAAISIILGQQKAATGIYERAIASADRAFAQKKYNEAILNYQSALKLKPTEYYPKEQIEAITVLLGQTKEQQENYKKTIAEADQANSEKQYELALLTYKAASEIKPGESYPKQKIASINIILGQQKARQDRYNTAIANADRAFDERNYQDALGEYKIAQGISPDENYPKERIESINIILGEQKTIQQNYSKAIQSAEKAYAAKDYVTAISDYQTALVFKPEEKYPQERITVLLASIALEKEKLDVQYTDYIRQADLLYSTQDFLFAQQAYKMASTLKPNEEYPRERYNAIADLLKAKAKAIKDTYDRAIADADKAYKSLIFDQAVALYTKALEIKPRDPYPGQMIARIRKYMLENSVVEITNESFLLKSDSEKRFRFKPVDMNLRKNNFLVVRARITGKIVPKVYVNYGSDNLKNGGIVLKNINSGVLSDFVINISVQDKWFREDNNWLSLYSENGEVEVTSIRISQGK